MTPTDNPCESPAWLGYKIDPTTGDPLWSVCGWCPMAQRKPIEQEAKRLCIKVSHGVCDPCAGRLRGDELPGLSGSTVSERANVVIVFWREWTPGSFNNTYDWRCYKGRAKLRNGCLHIYPCNGTRKKLSEFVAFDNAKSNPPVLVTSNAQVSGFVENLVNVGAIAEHLPPTYIDQYGNVRRTDRALSLVLMGPNWDAVKEDEFQTAIARPF